MPLREIFLYILLVCFLCFSAENLVKMKMVLVELSYKDFDLKHLNSLEFILKGNSVRLKVLFELTIRK